MVEEDPNRGGFPSLCWKVCVAGGRCVWFPMSVVCVVLECGFGEITHHDLSSERQRAAGIVIFRSPSAKQGDSSVMVIKYRRIIGM